LTLGIRPAIVEVNSHIGPSAVGIGECEVEAPVRHAAKISDEGLRGLWLAVALLAAVIAGVAGGAIYKIAGGRATESLAAGAAVFGGIMTLWFAAWRYLTNK